MLIITHILAAACGALAMMVTLAHQFNTPKGQLMVLDYIGRHIAKTKSKGMEEVARDVQPVITMPGIKVKVRHIKLKPGKKMKRPQSMAQARMVMGVPSLGTKAHIKGIR